MRQTIEMRQPPTRGTSPPRVLYYCHDTFGLGHFRRTLAIAERARARIPTLTQLIVTGSPLASTFRLPAGCDIVKMPAVVKRDASAYEPRSLDVPFDAVHELRSDILLAAARRFGPDVVVIDHSPAGLKGEANAALRWLREAAPRTSLVLGLRDIVDEPDRVHHEWLRDGVHHLLSHIYDRILIYGDRDVFDPVTAYGMSRSAAAKTEFVGYLGREPEAPVRARWRRPDAERLVVVTAGGGGDGMSLLRAAAEAKRRRPAMPMDCVLVSGPLMDESDRAQLAGLASGVAGLHFLDFSDELPALMGSADAVLSMGGYNTVCELLTLGRPTLLVPRVHPRREQLIRAEALAARRLVRMLHPEALSPERLLHEVDALLYEQAAPSWPVPLDGLANVARALDRLLSGKRTPIPFMPSAQEHAVVEARAHV